MFYSGNPKNPTEYNPVQNVGSTSDQNTLRPIEASEIFTQSVPSGDRTINGILVSVVSGERLNITGPTPSYIYGPINSNLTLAGGAQFPDGSAGAPSITFINDPDTGIYRSGDGSVAFTSNSTQTVVVGPNLQTNVPITTVGGQNLVLNPSGPSVDFTGHTLINVGGLAVTGSKYQVSEFEFTIASAAETPIAYMPWKISSWTGTTVRTFRAWVVPSPGTKNLTIRARDNGGAVIGSIVIAGGSAAGIYSFTVVAPPADTKIDISAERSVGIGSNPKIFGILFEAA